MFHKHISVYLLRKHDSNALTQYLIAPTKNVIGILYGRARSGLSGRAIAGGGWDEERENFRGSLNNHNSSPIIWGCNTVTDITPNILG